MFDLDQAIREWTGRLRRNETREEADLAVALTLATVGTRAVCAAKSNPVDCLHYE